MSKKLTKVQKCHYFKMEIFALIGLFVGTFSSISAFLTLFYLKNNIHIRILLYPIILLLIFSILKTAIIIKSDYFGSENKKEEQNIISNLKQFVTINKIVFARTFLQQSLGLMFKKEIPYDYGVFFEFKKPRNIVVHTFCIRFNLDIIFFGENQKVIRIVKNMQPWKFVKVNGVKEFLEIKGGTII